MKSWQGFRKPFFCASFLLLCLLSQISGAEEQAVGSKPIDRDILRGIELLYDEEDSQAENIFQNIITQRPEDPIGYFYLAMATWSKLVLGFWSSEMIEEYSNRIDQAIYVAKKMIESGKADNFTYFYLGGALGFKGRFQLMQRNYFSAFSLALEAIEALKTCLELDPQNRDVLFGLGIYDYYTARLSGVVRFLTYLLLHKGNVEEGIRKLHIAANEAVYSSFEAKSLLIHIYLFLEKDYQKALPIAHELTERFQNAPRYRYFQGISFIHLGRDSDYRSITDELRRKSRQESANPIKSQVWNRQALYLEASYYLLRYQTGAARSKLLEILSQSDLQKDPFMVAWPLLKIGMSHDLDGNRCLALQYYQQVQEMENGAGAQFLAEKCIKGPIIKGDPFLGY